MLAVVLPVWERQFRYTRMCQEPIDNFTLLLPVDLADEGIPLLFLFPVPLVFISTFLPFRLMSHGFIFRIVDLS